MPRHQSLYHVYEITTDDEDIQTPEPPPIYVNEPDNPEDIGFWRGKRTNTDPIDVDSPSQHPASSYEGMNPVTTDHRNRYAPDESEDSAAVFHEYAFGKGDIDYVIDLNKAEWANPMRRGITLAVGDQRYDFDLEGTVEGLMKSHSRSKCMNCSKSPEVEIIWANGHGRAWFCRSDFAKWKKESSWHEVDAVKPVTDGEVGNKWTDNKSRIEKAIFTARGREEGAKKTPDPQKNDAKTADKRGKVRYSYSASSAARHKNPNGNGEEAGMEPPHPGESLAETLGKITRTSPDEVKRLARRFKDSDKFSQHFFARNGKLCTKHGIRHHHLHHIHDASHLDKGEIPLVVTDKSGPLDWLVIDIEKADCYEPDLADEENVTDFDEEEYQTGIEYELKYTDSPQEARNRVMNRLRESPSYYSRLNRMEGQNAPRNDMETQNESQVAN